MNPLFDPFRAVEDHTLRSQYIERIINEYSSIAEGNVVSSIPKTIVQFWHNLEEIPIDVQECLDTWRPFEIQGFTRKLFDESMAEGFIVQELGEDYAEAFDRCHHPAMQCDYFRLCYLLIYGGFYVDADEVYQGIDCNKLFHDNRLKIQPLCYDNSAGEMIRATIFMNLQATSEDLIFYINNNPLIAPPNHPIIRIALERATKLLLTNPEKKLDIQSTTGPGNLTASLVQHCINCEIAGKKSSTDFLILPDWDDMSISAWPLSYRSDNRNWRLWKP